MKSLRLILIFPILVFLMIPVFFALKACSPQTAHAIELKQIQRNRGFTFINVSGAGFYTTNSGPHYVQVTNSTDLTCTSSLVGACWYNITSNLFKCCNSSNAVIIVGP